MYRGESFNQYLSHELKNPEFTKEFILSSLEGEDSYDLVGAIKRVISIMGVKEFSEISKINQKSISRMLSSETPPKLDTLNRYLAPFQLKATFSIEEVA